MRRVMMCGLVVAMLAPESVDAQVVTETLALGTALGKAEESFERIAGLEVAPDGRIVVLDDGDATVAVFDRTGRLLTVFGGAGDGPGEFRTIGASAIAGDTLIVLDRAHGRLTRFALDGSVLDTRRTGFAVGRHGFPDRMDALADGSLVLQAGSGCRIPPPEEGTDTQWRLLVLPPSAGAATGTTEPVEIHREERGDAIAVYGTAGGTFCGVLSFPFAPSPRAAVGSDGRIAYGTGSVSRIELHQAPSGTPGTASWFRRPEKSLDLPGDRRPVTRSDRQAWERAQVAERTGPDVPQEVADRFREAVGETEISERWAAYDRLVFDSGGDLWIRRPPAVQAAEATWDVVRGDGSRRGTVTLPADLVVHAIVGGTVYGVIKGEWDEDLVRGFSVRWE